MDWFLICAGLALLFFGGETTLRGAVALARILGMSPAVIGLTVVGFGTSAPELFVTVQAGLEGRFGLGVGNVVGSNISNILLILGVGGLVAPLVCDPATLRRDGVVMVAVSLLAVLLGLYGHILRWHGLAMVAGLIVFIGWSWMRDRKTDAAVKLREQEADEFQTLPRSLPVALLLLLFGLAALIGGAEALIHGATGLAIGYGVPESVIGLTLVALGTSLPELAATVVAARRGHADVAVANVMGSCIFNILLILGAAAMVTPIAIPADIAGVDMWVMLAAALLLLPMLFGDFRICRRDAALLLSGYAGYIGYRAARTVL